MKSNNSDTEFFWPVRVYYEDTDSGGVVYYANYLKFMERARSEWLRARGIEQDSLLAEAGVIFAVRSAQIEYLRPARFNDLLAVGVKVLQLGGASLTFEHSVTREGEDDNRLCMGLVKIACIDASTLRPRPIPEHVLTEITRGS